MTNLMQQRLTTHRFHFVGIGGIGMCGLAELLRSMGATVTGSDLAQNANTDRLTKLGIKVFAGHHESHVGEVDVVVFSSAVKQDNPEIRAARGRQIPLIPRAEALAEIMRLKRGIAVAGTHGKTTTTSMVASILLGGELQPTIVVGGRFDRINSTALLGGGDWLVAEADESDGSFSKLSPEIAIITNIDSDHLDHFKTFENLEIAFRNFAEKVPFYGNCIACGDDPTVLKVLKDYSKNVLFYGFESHNDFILKGASGQYEIFQKAKKLGELQLQVSGRHNALNALAAVIAGLQVGLSFEFCKKGISQFAGVDRRFQLKGEAKGVLVYDDYGHHPTEVRATLQAFRERFPDKKLVVLFQPHRYSRTENCWTEFISCFSQSDELILTDIYAAGETPIPGISSERLAAEVKHSACHYLKRAPSNPDEILENLQAQAVFITLGAGDVWKVGMEVLEKLKQQSSK